MKTILLTLFIVAVSTARLPRDSDAAETIVNRVPQGADLEAQVSDKKLKKDGTGAVVATDQLHPNTAVGNVEAQAASASFQASVIDKDNALTSKLHSKPKVEPINAKPDVELPQSILESKPEQLPVAAAHFNGPVPNDGLVTVQYHGPEEPGMMATLQEWVKMLMNYFNTATSPAAPVPQGAPGAPVAPAAPIHHHHHHRH
ncbi:hypothetical protein PYW07_005938 [Mythimna separata]|uniref:Uncharacterized protein n=1 Tax=Mythimna separata TaxID=271217 RepID=A0AAD7YKV8_MYTSE|nr:hypothetical protein PYW07_005938 [Mythimna separata]